MPVFKKILDGPDAKETEVIKTSSRIREVPSSESGFIAAFSQINGVKNVLG
jgi:hypothetical protein